MYLNSKPQATRSLALAKILTTVTAVALSLFTGVNVHAKGGKDGVGGGNTNAIEFRSMAKLSVENAVRVLKDPAIVDAGTKILTLINDEKVAIKFVDEELYNEETIDGKSVRTVVTALNYPKEKIIVVNEKRLNSVGYLARLQLAVHEFAGLASAIDETINDKSYLISAKLTDPSIFPMSCTADFYDGRVGAESSYGNRVGHINLVSVADEGQGDSLRWEGVVGGFTFSAYFMRKGVDIKWYSFSVFEHNNLVVAPNGGKSDSDTHYVVGTKWTGHLYSKFDSVTRPGYKYSIDCRDGTDSVVQVKPIEPDFDNVPRK